MTSAASVAALAQMAKPPVAALVAARLGQDYAQQQQARIINFYNSEALTTSFVQAPALGENSGPLGSDNTQWLKVEFHYSVNPADPQKYPWVDSAQFKIWIEGRDAYVPNPPPGSTQVAVCLTGSVTYINLKQARDAYGVFYVHPNVLSRYCGTGSYEDFDRKFNVHVEAYVGGKLVDYYDKNKDVDKWWTQPTAVPNLVCRQDQSPFLLSDITRYPQIKLPSSDSSSSQ
ncbi:MAG TPA: hypothetical protein VHY09_13950 [Candidatus Methylacidiphilales bacterium]|nr:hypothetical protein [Candidatus Methylacidiphilales bacterium]